MVSQLWKSCPGDIRIGGRDCRKAAALAAQFDGRVSATVLEVLDNRSLDAFCRQCAIIVNCAGPVMRLRDRAAQAAFRNRCHYVDAAGLSIVKEALAPQAEEIREAQLRFVISAGWMPGISELLPCYAASLARTRMESIDSVTVCLGDSGQWSANALRDAVRFVRRTGLRRPGYFHQGQWTRAKTAWAFRKINLGDPVGARRFGLYLTPELEALGRSLDGCDFLPYSYLSGLRTAMAATAIAAFPLPEALGVRMMRNVFRRNRLPVDGFAWARVIGRSGRDGLSLTVEIVYRHRRDYWIHGLALATVARMISEGRGVKPGVDFAAQAVDSAVFMAELEKAGVQHRKVLARLTVRNVKRQPQREMPDGRDENHH